MDPDCKPVIRPARKVPVSVRGKFKEELKRLEGLNVITPVDEPTEWVSQIVVAMKKSGELRICIDPKPFNADLKRERYQMPVIDDLVPLFDRYSCVYKSLFGVSILAPGTGSRVERA